MVPSTSRSNRSVKREEETKLKKKLREHFREIPLEELITACRNFSSSSRPDIHSALDGFFKTVQCEKQLGLHHSMERQVTFATLIANGWLGAEMAPLQYEDVDIGQAAPMRCLKNSLWLLHQKGLPIVVLLECCGHIHIEVVAPRGEEGLRFSNDVFHHLESMVNQARTYRGKALSLACGYGHLGRTEEVQVIKLPPVSREQVILPEQTLTLLERNVSGFVRLRNNIKKLGLSGRKGLLFYGPPGTGKTHTINYLASTLPDHTTLIVPAEECSGLSRYFALARVLQPSMIVIEDVDLIARQRGDSFFEGTMLNILLNEMDGLREDSDVLVVLTTNHPEKLEPALASRPGRIDQAIEFPLPDEAGRAKLLKLYSKGLSFSEELAQLIVGRTKGTSAAFIKELMRRAVQFSLERGGDGNLDRDALDGALNEMLFSGGSLNLKLLGGSRLGFERREE